MLVNIMQYLKTSFKTNIFIACSEYGTARHDTFYENILQLKCDLKEEKLSIEYKKKKFYF